MRGRLIRLLFTAAVLGALGWAARRALIRWIDGPAEEASIAPWGPVAAPAAESSAAAVAAPARPVPVPVPPRSSVETAAVGPTAPPAAVPAPKNAAKPARATKSAAAGGAWVAPGAAGVCPGSHPVKAKLSSRLYRVPGMGGYDRSSPDRCYDSAEAAEADGFSRAKR